MKIVFFGTPGFAASILEYLIEDGRHEIVGVVSKPNKPRGRDLKIVETEVSAIHKALIPTVPLFQPKKISVPESIDLLHALDADLFVVVAYGEIMSLPILSIPKYGCINIHASILPNYRGAAPMQRALLDGVSKSGVTLMKMDEGLDSGDIISIHEFDVPLDMNMEAFSSRMLHLSQKALLEGLLQIEQGSVIYTPQDHSKMSIAPKIKGEELRLFPVLETAHFLHNKIRAFSPKPGAYCIVRFRDEVKRLKIVRSSIIPKSKDFLSSSVLLVQDGPLFRMQLPSDSLFDISLERVQIEGKKEMSATEFLRGVRAFELVVE